MPWRRTRDPYAIWVSEAMLQQTRVSVVIPFYERFLRDFPDLPTLARASEERVLARWAGLGYYRRARHLRAAAALAVERHGGSLPRDPDAFAALPGVGRYTMGAVYSIAFGRRLPVVDGNVERVLSRLFALAGTREAFWSLAASLVPARQPGDFNQALMELGATICVPRSPGCEACPLAARCRAKALGRVDDFPLVAPRPATRRVRVAAALLESRRGLLMERVATGPNQGMLDPPWAASEASLRRRLSRAGFALADWREIGSVRHGIMNRMFDVAVYRARVKAGGSAASPGAAGSPGSPREWLSRRRLRDAPLTARARKALALESRLN